MLLVRISLRFVQARIFLCNFSYIAVVGTRLQSIYVSLIHSMGNFRIHTLEEKYFLGTRMITIVLKKESQEAVRTMIFHFPSQLLSAPMSCLHPHQMRDHGGCRPLIRYWNEPWDHRTTRVSRLSYLIGSLDATHGIHGLASLRCSTLHVHC